MEVQDQKKGTMLTETQRNVDLLSTELQNKVRLLIKSSFMYINKTNIKNKQNVVSINPLQVMIVGKTITISLHIDKVAIIQNMFSQSCYVVSDMIIKKYTCSVKSL